MTEIPDRLGHTISSLDYWLTIQQKNPHTEEKSRLRCHIFFINDRVLDPEIISLIKSLVPLKTHRIWKPTMEAIRWFSLKESLIEELITKDISRESGVFQGTKSLVERERTKLDRTLSRFLSEFDIDRERMVLFCVRDSQYGNAINLSEVEKIADYRNSTFTNYVDAVERLTQSGYFVIRMGNEHNEEGHLRLTNFWTYPELKKFYKIEQIEFFKECSFVVSSDTGLNKLAVLCRKPIYMVNMGSFVERFLHGLTPLVLYKSFLSIATGQHVSISEIISKGLVSVTDSAQYKAGGICVQENSIEDIARFVSEVIQYHESRWVQSEESKSVTKNFVNTLASHGHELGTFRFPNFYSMTKKWCH
jgi:putative glycosyltransferase (TIGR04372 family)